jgi:hypothetical protein
MKELNGLDRELQRRIIARDGLQGLPEWNGPIPRREISISLVLFPLHFVQ